MDGDTLKSLECITCDYEFKHGEMFLAHINNKSDVDCSQCMKCVDRMGANNTKEEEGGWLVLRREYDKYSIENRREER